MPNKIKKRELTSRADTQLDLHETGLNIGHNVIYLKPFFDFLVKLDGANQTPAMARQYVTTASIYLYFINQTKIYFNKCINEDLLSNWINTLWNKTTVASKTILSYITALEFLFNFLHVQQEKFNLKNANFQLVKVKLNVFKKRIGKEVKKRTAYNKTNMNLPNIMYIKKLTDNQNIFNT